MTHGVTGPPLVLAPAPLDVAAILVSIPVWTRDNERLEAPDTRPSWMGHLVIIDHLRRARA